MCRRHRLIRDKGRPYCPVRRAPQNSRTLMVTNGLDGTKGGQCGCGVTVTVAQCNFRWTHRLRRQGIHVLVMCSFCLNDLLTVMFYCADQRRGRNRSCITSPLLDALRKFTLLLLLVSVVGAQSEGSATVTKLAENQKPIRWFRSGCFNCKLLQRV